MIAGRSRKATGLLRITAMLFPVLAAACTVTPDPSFGTFNPGFSESMSATAPVVEPAPAAGAEDTETAGQLAEAPTMELPETIAYAPTTRTGEPLPVVLQAEAAVAYTAPPAMPSPGMVAVVGAPETVLPAGNTAAVPVPTAAPVPAESPLAAAAPEKTGVQEPVASNPVYATAAPPPAIVSTKKRSFFASLFGTQPAEAAPIVRQQAVPAKLVDTTQPAEPVVQLASAAPPKPMFNASAFRDDGGTATALPGVRQTALFEIKRKSGIDDDSDVDLHEEDDGPYQVAMAPGLARLAPNGLLTQTESVDVTCLKPALVRVLKGIESKYGRKMVVTSGYRNPDRNRRARGAKNSLHMYCAAADVQIPGVSKWELAKYVRTLPGRGGVGTYCHTESVHIDVGPERDWNWRCRRRRG